MAKLTTNDLVTLTNETSTVNTINNNFAAVETALENTLSRDGTSPNTMGVDLDLNQHRILNLPTPTAPTDVVRLQDLQEHNPLHPKAWAKVTGGASPALTASLGFASVSRPALGRILLTLSTAMSSANYCIQATVERASTALTVANVMHVTVRNATPTTTTFELECFNSTETTNVAVDPTAWYITVLGDN